jgi:hypothetical protein
VPGGSPSASFQPFFIFRSQISVYGTGPRDAALYTEG